jgi:hypothetical protein
MHFSPFGAATTLAAWCTSDVRADGNPTEATPGRRIGSAH